MDTKHLEQIIAILKENDVSEFELTEEGTHIKLTRSPGARGAPVSAKALELEPAIVQAGGAPFIETNKAQGAWVPADNLVKVESPLVGTFYRKPAPDAQPFVQEGNRVKKGDTLCIVEAMKLMNEIDATCDGLVEKVLVPDGQVVEYGEVLFLINPSV